MHATMQYAQDKRATIRKTQMKKRPFSNFNNSYTSELNRSHTYESCQTVRAEGMEYGTDCGNPMIARNLGVRD